MYKFWDGPSAFTWKVDKSQTVQSISTKYQSLCFLPLNCIQIVPAGSLGSAVALCKHVMSLIYTPLNNKQQTINNNKSCSALQLLLKCFIWPMIFAFSEELLIFWGRHYAWSAVRGGRKIYVFWPQCLSHYSEYTSMRWGFIVSQHESTSIHEGAKSTVLIWSHCESTTASWKNSWVFVSNMKDTIGQVKQRGISDDVCFILKYKTVNLKIRQNIGGGGNHKSQV